MLRTGASAGTPYRYSINKVTTKRLSEVQTNVSITTQVEVSDTGFYSCVAGNILGESVSSAYLQINRTSCLTAWPWLALLLLSFLSQLCQHINTLNTQPL